ncbi:ankyrin repeat-containing domain protein [Aspergillus germanicus]
MSDSEASSGSELGPLPVEADTIGYLCKALEGEGVSELQELSAEFWTRNKGKLDTLHNGRTALSLAAQKGNLRVVETLLDRGAYVNAKDDSGQTALFLAAQKGHCKIVETLLGRGADFKARYDRGRTALSYAAQLICVFDRDPQLIQISRPFPEGKGLFCRGDLDSC